MHTAVRSASLDLDDGVRRGDAKGSHGSSRGGPSSSSVPEWRERRGSQSSSSNSSRDGGKDDKGEDAAPSLQDIAAAHVSPVFPKQVQQSNNNSSWGNPKQYNSNRPQSSQNLSGRDKDSMLPFQTLGAVRARHDVIMDKEDAKKVAPSRNRVGGLARTAWDEAPNGTSDGPSKR